MTCIQTTNISMYHTEVRCSCLCILCFVCRNAMIYNSVRLHAQCIKRNLRCRLFIGMLVIVVIFIDFLAKTHASCPRRLSEAADAM